MRGVRAPGKIEPPCCKGVRAAGKGAAGELAPTHTPGTFPHPRPRSGLSFSCGVSLEQGVGLTDISRGRSGRRAGDKRSSLPDYYFIIDKINPSS